VAMMLLVLAPTGSLRVGEWSEMVQLCTVSVLAVGVVSIVARTRRSLNQRVPRGSVLRGG
jgi:hypothetical protein